MGRRRKTTSDEQSEHVKCSGNKAREARLRRFWHGQRRDSEHISSRMLRLELAGRKQRGDLWT